MEYAGQVTPSHFKIVISIYAYKYYEGEETHNPAQQ